MSFCFERSYTPYSYVYRTHQLRAFFMRFFISLFLIGCASEEAVKVYNNAPSATITSHSSGESFLSGYSTSFQAQIQDDNHSAARLVVVWSTNQGVLCEAQNPSVDGVSACNASLEEGDTFVRVQVTDPEGEAAIAEITVEVAPSFAPTVTILSPNAQDDIIPISWCCCLRRFTMKKMHPVICRISGRVHSMVFCPPLRFRMKMVKLKSISI